MNLRQALQDEWQRRRRGNPRYSLRAYARDLGTDHASLSQILRGRRNLSPRLVWRFGRRLRLPAETITDLCAQTRAETVLRLVQSPSFVANSRWIATRTGIPLDAVNATLHRLLHRGDLVMATANRWIVTRAPYA